ncbi:hypothetical protein A8V23_12850 [Yersinia pestis]|uniref:Uncharacterized protein n=3 Tax=Yersinia pestis TaxID=632 RepID=A0AAX2HZZ8_YERPE|nr:hypothetical protein YPC_1196 [Yersinia pestis biovar Medievalis str. Harbin 35]AEL74529.1 hypothetical protein A1122_19575 [Yersinia pestis A1122]AIN14406.1 hypothetical protein DJ40_1070 [Yersinia pseudotuberculosis]AJI89679.1 hypothetical protein CH59_705 [Yersinia pestis]AJI98594.1 hypothetical protein BZ18_3882 [Yersinia pestis Pestoides F]AJJ56909.1 hypothetical protein BZ17_1356 [Yersinia pseudotuberculosis IP 32953]AJJ65483.1 hypothetical protein BZ16_566 [Yersinia pseudotuberculos
MQPPLTRPLLWCQHVIILTTSHLSVLVAKCKLVDLAQKNALG